MLERAMPPLGTNGSPGTLGAEDAYLMRIAL
jgi:hypothetical protein